MREKKPRAVKPPTKTEKQFLQNLFGLLIKELEETPGALNQLACDCDLEMSNLCRYKRETTNARIISIKRICEMRNKKLWQVVKEAEETTGAGEGAAE